MHRVAHGLRRYTPHGPPLQTAPIEVPGAPTNITCRSVTLNPTLKAGATTTIRSFSVYTHTLVPFPAKITQKDQQLVVFEDYVHIVSPYAVASAETQVCCRSSVPAVQLYISQH